MSVETRKADLICTSGRIVIKRFFSYHFHFSLCKFTRWWMNSRGISFPSSFLLSRMKTHKRWHQSSIPGIFFVSRFLIHTFSFCKEILSYFKGVHLIIWRFTTIVIFYQSLTIFQFLLDWRNQQPSRIRVTRVHRQGFRWAIELHSKVRPFCICSYTLLNFRGVKWKVSLLITSVRCPLLS